MIQEWKDMASILIVDDKEENLFALENILRRLDVEIIKASSGDAALRATLRHSFALAILDVQMPEMDGYELATLLRSDSKTGNLPIIFLSAVYFDDPYIFRGYESGAVDFITKPFHAEILLSKVKVFLDLDAQKMELVRQKAKLEALVAQLEEEIEAREQVENALRISREHLRKAHDELERRVEQRTRDLATANRVLLEQTSLLDLAHDAIMVQDSSNRILYWNRGAEETYGWTRNEAMGQVGSELLRTRFPEELEKIRSTVLEKSQWEGELVQYTRGGSSIVVASRWALQRDMNGDPAGVLVINRDITKRKMAEVELGTYMARLELVNRELQEFASVAAHDLKEPLRKIQAFADRLKNRYGGSLDETATDYLSRMESAANRMQSLLEALLRYSRVATQTTPFEPIDLADLAREVVSDLEVFVERTGGTVNVGVLPCMEADPAQMRQLFQNLITNALKFNSSEAPTVTIHGEPCSQGAYRILIEDNGIGFDEVFLDRIFQPFQRLHARGSEYEGTGMGLAICRKIVERHKGSITARSTPGKGTTFIVTLPARQNPPDHTPVM